LDRTGRYAPVAVVASGLWLLLRITSFAVLCETTTRPPPRRLLARDDDDEEEEEDDDEADLVVTNDGTTKAETTTTMREKPTSRRVTVARGSFILSPGAVLYQLVASILRRSASRWNEEERAARRTRFQASFSRKVSGTHK
jgi:hypothetical protein